MNINTDSYNPAPAAGEKSRKHIGGAPIRVRIFLTLALFSAIIIVILWLCQVVFLDSIYKSIKTAEITSAAEKITEHIDSSDLSETAENIAYRTDLCVLIMRVSNDIPVTKTVNIHTQQNCAIHNVQSYSLITLYNNALNSENGCVMQHFRFDTKSKSYLLIDEDFNPDTDEPEIMIYSAVKETASGRKLFILLNSVISPVSSTTRTLFYLLILISVLLAVLSVVLALIFSRSISKPIEELNVSAKRLAKRDYSASFSEEGFREAAELGRTLNTAASELSKVDDLCRELIANISHDLRTPLTMITGYGEVIRDLPGENTPENIQIIIDEANRLTSLVNDVLDISRFSSGQQKFECGYFCITDSVKNAVARYAKLCEREGYNITFEYNEELYVYSDESRILQVLCNLINNAITYTGADKRVAIRQSLNNGRVNISVTDTGDGIPQDKIELIWERYYKVDAVHKRAAVGTGLGLSIVRQIIDMAHGSCGVSSRMGEGSTFWFELDTVNGYSEIQPSDI